MLIARIACWTLCLAFALPAMLTVRRLAELIAVTAKRRAFVRDLGRSPGELVRLRRMGFTLTFTVVSAEPCPFTGRMLLLLAEHAGTFITDERPSSVDPVSAGAAHA